MSPPSKVIMNYFHDNLANISALASAYMTNTIVNFVNYENTTSSRSSYFSSLSVILNLSTMSLLLSFVYTANT